MTLFREKRKEDVLDSTLNWGHSLSWAPRHGDVKWA